MNRWPAFFLIGCYMEYLGKKF